MHTQFWVEIHNKQSRQVLNSCRLILLLETQVNYCCCPAKPYIGGRGGGAPGVKLGGGGIIGRGGPLAGGGGGGGWALPIGGGGILGGIPIGAGGGAWGGGGTCGGGGGTCPGGLGGALGPPVPLGKVPGGAGGGLLASGGLGLKYSCSCYHKHKV